MNEILVGISFDEFEKIYRNNPKIDDRFVQIVLDYIAEKKSMERNCIIDKLLDD